MRILLTICLLLAALNARAGKLYSLSVSNDGVLFMPQPNTNFWQANSNGINAVVKHPEFGLATNSFQLQGLQIFKSSVTNGIDTYLLDFGRTNSLGQPYIYNSILATNRSRMVVTNCSQWGLLSLNVVASANVFVFFPTNLPHLDTNGLTFSNGVWGLVLTNGNELRMTFQSNITMSSLWTTFGQ